MATMCEVNHRGRYLLLMSFYHQIDHRRQLLKLSECSSPSDVQAFQPFLRGLPECKTLTSQALTSYLNQDHPEPVFRLTKWMQSAFGQKIYPPPELLRVSDRFDGAVMFHGQTSVRWYGTAINTFHSILQNGFLTDKIWTAGMPGVLWRYAFKKGAREALEAVRHPLFDHGVLLGLEVAGPPNKNIVTHLQVEADRYMVR
ncbi:ab182baf-5ddd-4042-ac10-e7520039f2e7-CDS [Sclerotinia trifoliorum]|uniref:Ab182baf-5ddd-4042-ac10-e7520039f2e7-CDS n=1 Tax=Sclerotinia trifoliorum TaxID=28548 RepID=A0A8H2VRR8_9HELO|nr:ab182baf-5ddd-4042-ac10-e7520039f2e7-CDS [Sclerotinia trifoliorum]